MTVEEEPEELVSRTDVGPWEEVLVVVGPVLAVFPTLIVTLDFACPEVKLGELADGTDTVVMELIVEVWDGTALSLTLTVEIDWMVVACVEMELEELREDRVVPSETDGGTVLVMGVGTAPPPSLAVRLDLERVT